MAESRFQPPTEGRPSASQHPKTANGLVRDDLVRHLQEDQRARWLRHDRVRIEAYLEQFPTLRTQADTVVELVKCEYALRLANGEQPAVEEYVRSFPEYETELLSQFRTALDSTPPSQCEFEAWVLQSTDPTGADVNTRSLSPDFSSPISNGSPFGATMSGGAHVPDNGIADPHKITLGPTGEPQAYTGLRIGVYDVRSEIGRGGMGVVYKAHDARLNRLVALKMIRAGAHASQEETLRFLAEAEAVAQVQHPNIVQIYEINRHRNQPFIAFEFVDGVSLHKKLKSTPMPAAESAALLETLARAIHVVHQHGIIHRDLKPANVLLTTDGQPKITDFGLAKRIEGEEHLTQTGAILGTPSYMSPEQADGKYKEVGPASDIYALGAILYELLTGRPPFRGETSFDTILQVRSDEPVPPSKLRPKVSADLETICLKCLNKQPAKRYASAEELARDLHRFSAGEPIVARPVGVWERGIKWAKRRPLAAALAVISAVAIVSVVIGSISVAYTMHLQNQHEVGLQRRYQECVTRTLGLVEQAETDLEKGVSGLQDARISSQSAVDLLSETTMEEFRTCDGTSELGRLQSRARDVNDVARRRIAGKANRDYFIKLHDEALFQGSRLLEADLLPDRDTVADKAVQALSLYQVHPENGDRIAFDPDWSEPQRNEIRERCYEVLLVLAETEFLKKDAARALRILDRAARLDVTTCASHLRRAAYLTSLGRHADAQAASLQAESTRPKSSLDHFLVGMHEYSRRDYVKAERAFENASGMNVDHFWATYYLSLCQLRRHNSEAALRGLAHCLSQRKDFVWGYLLRGFAYGQLGKFALARNDFDRARQANDAKGLGSGPQTLYSILLNRGTLALREQSANDPARAVGALHPLFVVGLAPVGAVQHIKLKEALEHFEQAVQVDSTRYHAFSYMAKAHQTRGDWPRAEQCYQQALEVARAAIKAGRAEDFIIADLLSDRADLHVRAGQPDAALRDLKDAVRLRVGTSDAVKAARAKDHAACGLILYGLKQFDNAGKAFDAALEEQPNHLASTRGRAYAMYEVSGLTPETHRAISMCIQNGGEDADLYLMRGRIDFDRLQYERALDDFTRALLLRPSSAAYTYRGWTRFFLQFYQLAYTDFDRALLLDGTSAHALSGRGLTAALSGEHDRAVRDTRAAMDRQTDESTLLNASRTYSVLSSYAGAANRAKSPPVDSEEYQRYAVRLLSRAFDHMDRATYSANWRNLVANDPLLKPLSNRRDFEELRMRIARSAAP